MARSVRRFFLAAALIATTAIPLFAENDAAATASVVALTSRETSRLEQAERPASLLIREVMRQAFLIAARDECGLATRDTTLREAVPAGDNPQTLYGQNFQRIVLDESSRMAETVYVAALTTISGTNGRGPP